MKYGFSDDIRVPQLDISDPKTSVEVEIRADRRVLWVHIEGCTVLRVCGITNLILNENK